MKIKTLFVFFPLIIVLVLSAFFSISTDAKTEEIVDLPQEEGIYDVPGHPKMKLHVFVYRDRKQSSPAKPQPNPTPVPTTCSSDTDSTSVDTLTGWHLPANSTINYYLNKNSVPSTIGAVNFPELVKRSFAEWQKTEVGTNALINFQEAYSVVNPSKATLDSKNTITWGRTSGSALAINYTWYDSTSGYIENDTVFNSQVPWIWSANTCYTGYYDAQNILTHELGHWMGLNDQYTDNFSNNTMYGYGSKAEVKKDTLTTGDINAVNTIY